MCNIPDCVEIISFGVSIAAFVFIIRVYIDTKTNNPLNFYDPILKNQTDQILLDGPPGQFLNDLEKYCKCGEEALNNICSEEQIISGCYDVSKNDKKALLRSLSYVNCGNINKQLKDKRYDKIFDLGYRTVNKMALGILIIYAINLGIIALCLMFSCTTFCCKEYYHKTYPLLDRPIFIIDLVLGLANIVLHIILMLYYYKGLTTGEFLDYYDICATPEQKIHLETVYKRLKDINSEMTAFVTLNFIEIFLNYLWFYLYKKTERNLRKDLNRNEEIKKSLFKKYEGIL